MKFTKVESVGNDYVLLDAIEDPALARTDDLTHLAQILSRRRTGVGADGLLIVTRDDDGCAMRVINADGSAGGVCGNGLRCAVKLIMERGHAETVDDALPIRVGGRTLLAVPSYENDRVRTVRVDMGPPAFEPGDLPLDPAHAERASDGAWLVAGHRVHVCSMGNPHAVLFGSDAPIEDVGPKLCDHPAFPERTNVHTVHIESSSRVRIAHWERGAGATHGCGTGVCAIIAVGVRRGMLEGDVRADVPGGSLVASWSGTEGDGVMLEGPARLVYEGEWTL